MDIFLILFFSLLGLLVLVLLIKCVICCRSVSHRGHTFTRLDGRNIKGRAERAKLDSRAMESQPYFLNKDNLYIFWRSWESRQDSLAVVVMCHGLSSHCGRLHHVAKSLNEKGLKVYALDHQGHGLSEGDRLYVKSMDDFIDDVIWLIEKAKTENPEKKIFLFGHSMGGLIAAATTLKAQESLSGTVLSAPALVLNPAQVSPTTVRILSWIAPRLPKFRPKGLDNSTITHDLLVKDHFANDPLRPRENPTLALSFAIVRAQEEVTKRASEIELPFTILHGKADQMVIIKGSEMFIEKISSTDKSLIRYDNAYHELLNEPLGVFQDDEIAAPLDVVANFVLERL